MGFFKKWAGVFGYGRDDTEQEVMRAEEKDVDSTGISSSDGDNRRFHESGLPRKGFGVPVKVAVEKSVLGPVLQPCVTVDGGIQVDGDGDVADEFLEESLTEDDNKFFKTKHKTNPAKVRGLMVSSDGKLQQCIEHRGRLLIV